VDGHAQCLAGILALHYKAEVGLGQFMKVAAKMFGYADHTDL
jgi:hypothetical protein